MTALNLELFAMPLTVKVNFCEQNLETLWKLQLRTSSSATGNPTPQVSSSAGATGMVHWFRGQVIRPVSGLSNPPQHRPILQWTCTVIFADVTCAAASSGISKSVEEQYCLPKIY